MPRKKTDRGVGRPALYGEPTVKKTYAIPKSRVLAVTRLIKEYLKDFEINNEEL